MSPILVVLLLATPRLDVDHVPARVPRTLAMRAETPSPPVAAKKKVAELPILGDVSDLERKVIFKFQLGYGVDQGRELTGFPLPSDVRKTRIAYLGDLVLGTNGLVRPSLATYLATHFYFDQSGTAPFQALPEVYDAFPDGQAILVRSAWAQLDHVFSGTLRPLWLRAGRQWRWGQGGAAVRFDGLALGWDDETVRGSLWAGRRVALYSLEDRFGLGGDAGVVAGASLRIGLRRLVGLPLALSAESMRWDEENHVTLAVEADVPGAVDAGARVRVSNGDVAQIAGSLRARLSRVSTFQIELDERLSGDWTYDYVINRDESSGRLNFGAPIPRFRASVRGGTVLFGNWDVLMTGALVWEHDPAEESSFQPTYLEGGGGVSARFFGGLSAGIEVRLRRFYRELAANVSLVDSGALGEIASREGYARLRYSLGVKRFTGEAVFFARQLLVDRAFGAGESYLTTGVQFRLEGWVTPRVRLVSEYELAGEPGEELQRFVNLRGLQSLRVLAEATF